jgi:hypothetical protein
VLRHSGLHRIESGGNHADRLLAVREHVEDPYARGIAERARTRCYRRHLLIGQALHFRICPFVHVRMIASACMRL